MKNRIAKANAEPTTVEFTLTARLTKERLGEFDNLARNLRLTRDQLGSAMIDGSLEGDKDNAFEEIGTDLLQTVTELYPESHATLGRLRVAFGTSLAASRALNVVRREVGAI